MNASSNALVGELRKHPCGALGAGKQQRLAAGGSRGAHVARLASAGARGRSMAKNAQTSSLPTSLTRLFHSIGEVKALSDGPNARQAIQ